MSFWKGNRRSTDWRGHEETLDEVQEPTFSSPSSLDENKQHGFHLYICASLTAFAYAAPSTWNPVFSLPPPSPPIC